MKVKEIKDIMINNIKYGWVEIADSDYYITQIKEANKHELESILSEIEEFAVSGIEFVHDMIDELDNLL